MTEINLMSTTDATLWAKEFVERFPNGADEATMLSWFSSAMCAARDDYQRKYPERIKKDIEHRSIRTITGKLFYPTKPDVKLICLEDIAHSLSMLPRYTGHTRFPWPVGQHVLLGLRLIRDGGKIYSRRNTDLERYWVLHDAAEAYFNDLSKPLKEIFTDYTEEEGKLQTVIFEKYLKQGLCPEALMYRKVKEVDDLCRRIEQSQLQGKPSFSSVLPYNEILQEMSWINIRHQLLCEFSRLGIKDDAA